jgi:hypothetical protein
LDLNADPCLPLGQSVLNISFKNPDSVFDPGLSGNNDKIYGRKQRRTYRTLMGGFRRAELVGSEMKFLTLTTSSICADQDGYCSKTLTRDYIRLIQRIKRITPQKLIKWGYLKHGRAVLYYGRNNLTKKLWNDFEYAKVHTNEGNGVLHVVFRGCYLPYNYLVCEWMDIHVSWELNISDLDYNKSSTKKKAVNYVVSQYCADQEAEFVRLSTSRNWIFPGCSRVWKDMVNIRLRDWSKQEWTCFYDSWFWYAPFFDDPDVFAKKFKSVLKDWDDLIYYHVRGCHPGETYQNSLVVPYAE